MKKAVSLAGAALAMAVFATACSTDTTGPAAATAPNRPSFLLSPSGTVVVSPSNMHGWTFYDDATDASCADATVCQFVVGPAEPPAGVGSAELATPTSGDQKALILPDYAGTRFADITALSYSTYRQSADAGNNLAIALQFNVDYDLTDATTGYMGRIVFEPYQGAGGTVTQNTWQAWNALNGKWWGSRSTATTGNISGANPCVQATPCTWSALLVAFPDIGVHATYGAVVLKAGSSWPGFRGNVDNLTIGVSNVNTTYDFEPPKASCMNGGWMSVKRADGSSFKNQGACVAYLNTGK